jgi:amino acid adenylation domain-containing protein
VLSASLRAQIAERKQELLQLLRSNNQSAELIAPPIIPRKTSNATPLSFAQERLWFLEQLEPGRAVYNICRASRLTGQLNLSVLEASLNEIVRRHEVLRSAIRVADGRPAQVVQPRFELKISVTDLQRMADRERERELSSRIQQAADRPFDFSSGKFLQAALLRIANDEHTLVLTTHHIVSDAWSMGILTRELWSLYEAYAAGNSPPLRDHRIQYADFAVWQREWLQGEVLDRQVSYWKKRLKDLPKLNLPTDRPRPVRQSFHGARTPISLPEALTAAINELSNQSGVTPFMTLLAAFQVLLSRYCGQEDIVIGSPIANRSRTELESLIGFFVNTLVLRSDLSGNQTFRELLARVREVCLGAYAHQDVPFEKLVQELQPERDQSRNPLFQIMFVLQNAPRPITDVQGLRIEAVERENARSQFDLSLFLREREGRYIGYFQYSTDLFDASTIERMAGHFVTLLEGIVADSDQPISTLPLLSNAERHRLLVEWNDTAADYPKGKCIHELFEQQVERTPDAIAAIFNEERLTYGELNARANQLSHYLQRLGVGPEVLVGIYVERSLAMLVGLFGVLKAGGAYVPLDPAYPRERLAFMVEDAQVSVLLTQKRLIEDRGWEIEDGDPRSSRFDPQLRVVFVDQDLSLIEREGSHNPKIQTNPNNVAYVIYTSGSTGQPKGVAIEHRNACNLLHWANGVYRSRELESVLASTSICFDLSVFELFAPLSWGGKVVLVENALCLRESPAADEITLINTVPSVMTALVSAGGLPASVQTVNLAGELLRPELVKQIYDLGIVERVYDLYGPSETTTYSTFALRTPDGLSTIGRPISNTQVYLLDSNLQPVPIGARGEIYIAGAGVTRGYLNRSELTSGTFISNPFLDERGSTLYRTGDLARYLPDGNIELLGRADNQVKIRGYRIELGEIEAVLNQHPAVKDTVVVALARDPLAEKTLIGYVVPRQQSVSLLSQLRPYLSEKIPDYMIPSTFVILDSLPLAPNGKIDRSALPAPEGGKPESTERLAEPRTEIEELVAQTWREVLHIENIGIHENFFELGGHSLLATQIVAKLCDTFDTEIPLNVLFDAPTIAELSAEIEKLTGHRDRPPLPPIALAPRDGPLPLSMNQERLWRLDQMMHGTHFFNMPYVYQLSGTLNVEALEQALTEVVRRHEALRTVFREVEGNPVQIIKDGSDVQLQTMDLRARLPNDASETAAASILEERSATFDLAAGPLCRVKLLFLTETDALLLVTMHHIISDHWSMQVFYRDLVSLYESFQRRVPLQLPDPQIQFGDFAFWERLMLDSGRFHEQAKYWNDRITAACAEAELHTGTSVKGSLVSEFYQQPIDIDERLLSQIRYFASQQNCTPFTVVLSAVFVLARFIYDEPQIRIATLMANRLKLRVETGIGHFLNTVIITSGVSAGDTFSQIVRRVRRIILEAHERQEFPFEQLARDIEKEHGLGRESLTPVLFNYRKRAFSPVNAAGLIFAPCILPTRVSDSESLPAAYDFIFDVRETSTTLTGTVNVRDGISGQRGASMNLQKILNVLVSEPTRVLSTLTLG